MAAARSEVRLTAVVRRMAVAIVAAVLLVGPLPAGRAATVVLVIDGKGFGHGVGMAQDGALAMGRARAPVERILGQFYPGTGIARATGAVRVPVLAPGAEATVQLPQGGVIRELSGSSTDFPVDVRPGGTARLSWDGQRYRVRVEGDGGPAASAAQLPASTTTSTTTTSTTSPVLPPSTTTSSTTTTTVPPGAPAATRERTTASPLVVDPEGDGVTVLPARGRRYRGVVHASAAGGPFRLVNELDVETYLKGMGEVRDPRWPLASLKAQAIAARTYALRAMAAGGEICETQRCQVYLGAQAEYPAMNRAVDESRGQVLVFRGRLISAVYSANGGGFSASTLEGFGTTGTATPYLRAAPYPVADPFPWTVRVALPDVARRFGYAGTLRDVRVVRRGPSGRALEVVLDGDGGTRSVTGIAFDAGLGLRSTLFTLRSELGEAPPPPPPSEDAVAQALPEEAAALAAVETTTTTSAVPPSVVPSLPAGPRSAAAAPLEGEAPVRHTSLTAFALLLLVAVGAGAAGALRSTQWRPIVATWRRRGSAGGGR